MKLYSRIIALFVFISMFFSIPISVRAESKNTQYEYTCLPGTDEWIECKTALERYNKNIVPDEIVTDMSTEALIIAFLNNPFSIDLLLFSSAKSGYDSVRQMSNLLQELERREDAFNELCNILYMSDDVDQLNKMKIEMIIVCGEYSLSPSQKTAKEIMEKQELTVYQLYPELKMLHEREELRLNYPETPSGNPVDPYLCEYNRTELSSTLLGRLEEAIEDEYGLSSVSPATNKYNCHSYAWHSQDTGNLWWIYCPDDYIADPYYSLNNSVVCSGNKVVYRVNYSGNYEHSGIVVGVGSGSGANVGVISKWGAAGVYVHNIYNCPPEYGQICTFYSH